MHIDAFENVVVAGPKTPARRQREFGIQMKRPVQFSRLGLAWILVLLAMLPLYVVETAFQQTLAPAHYHRAHHAISTPSVPAADDVVLGVLPPKSTLDASHRADGKGLADRDIAYHTHASSDPSVIYVGDVRPDGTPADLAGKAASDTLVMLPVEHVGNLPRLVHRDCPSAAKNAFRSQHTLPLERPPAV